MRLADRVARLEAPPELIACGPDDAIRSGEAARLALPRVPGGAVVALSIVDPIAFVRALLALDGVAARLLLLAPALPGETIVTLMAEAGATVLVSDRADLPRAVPAQFVAGDGVRTPVETRWIMTTSGTTGLPKMVAHRLESLVRTVSVRPGAQGSAWGLIYEPSRFAGLQVVLQALLSGTPLIAGSATGDLWDSLKRFAEAGVTHLSATPTLWRKILMLSADALPLKQITLGGEIADAHVLRALQSRWPDARVVHIYASTELGVGISVGDGLPGFPARLLAEGARGADLKVVDGLLWARPRSGPRPEGTHLEVDGDGFLCTGDRVALQGDRVLFLGRDSSLVNIGGTKVQPEVLELAALGHPHVAAARVLVRPSPITGSLLQLQVVAAADASEPTALAAALKAYLRERLPRELQPMSVKVVDDIGISAAGKVERRA
jgi:acyl-CoA synthetase (AMP-forming)/AMP-acid ligase II